MVITLTESLGISMIAPDAAAGGVKETMKFHMLTVIVLVLAAIVSIPGVSAENQTMDTAYYLTHAETLAGQKDMSMYNKPHPVEPLVTMNESAARLYPNVTWCGKDCMVTRPCSFPFIRCESLLTVMVVYNVNTSCADQPGPVIGYGMGGWPLQNPVFVPGSGISNLNLPFGTLAGMFSATEIVSVDIAPSTSYLPSREFLEYVNAPAITREQKESALRIALTSKKFQSYMNESHGPISFGWAYPYSGMVRLSMTAGSATSRVYGLASVYIDIDRGVLDNESFIDWKKYW
ncbi:MAG: hypothetical protein WC593_00470 [Methanoregula sp.]